MRTTDPTQYWLIASGRIESALIGDPMRIVLVARSQTFSAGGLIFDPKPWLLLGLGIVVFSLLFWWPLIASITRTIRRMMQTTRQIADGRFDVRVNLHRRDELGSLSESIDQMAIRLDGLVAGQKRFLGDIAHELCSPLARLQMALGILEQKASTEQAQFVQTASEKAQQISALVGELLSFSKASFGSSAVQLKSVPLREVIVEAARREKMENGPEIEINIPEELCVSADRELLVRAFSNLIRNAIQHAGTSGPISIRAVSNRSGESTAAEGEDVETVTVLVGDHGPGVPLEELSKIFDAFYRLDTSRTRATGGTGLGLAIVKTCIESCCGTVSARNRQPRGLEVLVTLHKGKPAEMAAEPVGAS
jgi:two-component system sensor histidine kinase CpxA